MNKISSFPRFSAFFAEQIRDNKMGSSFYEEQSWVNLTRASKNVFKLQFPGVRLKMFF